MVTSIAVKNPELVMQMKQLFPDACEIFINKCVNQGLDLDALLDKFASGKNDLLIRFAILLNIYIL